MASVPIPPEMLPSMDWHAEEKLAAWEYFTDRMRLYFSVAHTTQETKVDNILFFGWKEASE